MFVQVGLVVLMGLACKNAILIVEFARELEPRGRGVIEAALEACRLRLRPIVMTSIAFIVGSVPLLMGRGAGSEVRAAIGITVFSGMLGVTLFGLFLTPVFYVALRRLRPGRPVQHDHEPVRELSAAEWPSPRTVALFGSSVGREEQSGEGGPRATCSPHSEPAAQRPCRRVGNRRALATDARWQPTRAGNRPWRHAWTALVVRDALRAPHHEGYSYAALHRIAPAHCGQRGFARRGFRSNHRRLPNDDVPTQAA